MNLCRVGLNPTRLCTDALAPQPPHRQLVTLAQPVQDLSPRQVLRVELPNSPLLCKYWANLTFKATGTVRDWVARAHHLRHERTRGSDRLSSSRCPSGSYTQHRQRQILCRGSPLPTRIHHRVSVCGRFTVSFHFGRKQIQCTHWVTVHVAIKLGPNQNYNESLITRINIGCFVNDTSTPSTNSFRINWCG